ncbi:MAG: hypothetical protein ABSH44_03695 [Bryobacteraceae bacterium]|jgi:hypothetical protein
MTPEDQNEVRAIVRDEVTSAKAELIETMRDMQTEIVRGLERFARGNFARMHRLEGSDNDMAERLNALEERVLAVETRLPPLA